MRKGSKKLEHCKYIDFSPLVPDNPQPPVCNLGRNEFSTDCMKPNLCPGYKSAWGISWEALKKKLGL